MKITSEKDQQSQYIVRIEIDPAELEEAKGKAAKKLSNQLRIPGFRPGKAPRALVERFVGQESLIEQATKDLLPKAYQNAIKQEDIKPIADPQFDIESTDPLVLVATIPVEPTVELGNYREIRFDLPPTLVTDEEVDKVLNQLVEQQSTWEEPETERAAQDGDQVELEMHTVREGEAVGEPFERSGVLGKGELLGQIDDQVAGMNVGEEKIIEIKRNAPAAIATDTDTLETETADENEVGSEDASLEANAKAAAIQEEALDEQASAPDVADLPEVETLPLDEDEADTTPMTFKVKLNSVKVQHKPELNDEFAQSVTDVKTLDELLGRIRKNLETQQDNNNKRELTEKVIKEAVVLSSIQMPPVMIDAEIHALEDGMAERLKQQKLSLDQYLQMVGKDHEAFHEELRPQAEDRIRTALVLREIAQKEGITVEQGDLDREVEKMVDEFTLSVPEEQKEERAGTMRTYLAQDQMRNQLREELFSRKLSDRLVEIAAGIEPGSGTASTDDADVPSLTPPTNYVGPEAVEQPELVAAASPEVVLQGEETVTADETEPETTEDEADATAVDGSQAQAEDEADAKEDKQ